MIECRLTAQDAQYSLTKTTAKRASMPSLQELGDPEIDSDQFFMLGASNMRRKTASSQADFGDEEEAMPFKVANVTREISDLKLTTKEKNTFSVARPELALTLNKGMKFDLGVSIQVDCGSEEPLTDISVSAWQKEKLWHEHLEDHDSSDSEYPEFDITEARKNTSFHGIDYTKTNQHKNEVDKTSAVGSKRTFTEADLDTPSQTYDEPSFEASKRQRRCSWQPQNSSQGGIEQLAQGKPAYDSLFELNFDGLDEDDDDENALDFLMAQQPIQRFQRPGGLGGLGVLRRANAEIQMSQRNKTLLI